MINFSVHSFKDIKPNYYIFLQFVLIKSRKKTKLQFRLELHISALALCELLLDERDRVPTWDCRICLVNITVTGHNRKIFQSDLLVPGDSSRDLFYPLVGFVS